MILKDLKIFFTKHPKITLLSTQSLKSTITSTLFSFKNYLGQPLDLFLAQRTVKAFSLVGIPNYPNWLTFARESNLVNDSPRVIIYVNIRLLSLCFSLRKDIINYRDILLVSFSNNNIVS